MVGATGTLPYFDGPQADVYYFEIVDVVRRMRSLFGYGGGGLAIPTLLPAFLSVSATGPFTDFTTSRSESLSSFDGAAQLYQDPGITVGPGSAGGTLRLKLESRTLVSHVTLVNPSIIPIAGGTGFGVGAGSATRGTLRMLFKATPVVGAL